MKEKPLNNLIKMFELPFEIFARTVISIVTLYILGLRLTEKLGFFPMWLIGVAYFFIIWIIYPAIKFLFVEE